MQRRSGDDVGADLRALLGGDETAWPRLLERLWPDVERQVARSRSLGPMRASADDRNEVVSLVFTRLRRDGYRALRLHGDWQRRHPDKGFGDWLAIVTANVLRDYVSTRLAGGTAVERLIDTLTESMDERGGSYRPPYTSTAAAHELLDRAERSLPPDQLGPLASWLRGHEFEEIATMHNLVDGRQAQAKVRAALGRLRHQVREG